MASLLPIAASVAGPLLSGLIGKIFHHKGDGMRKGGMSMMGGKIRKRRRGHGMMGGKMGRRGKGWMGNFLRGALSVGKKIFKVATDKRVHGLVKHGINTYKNVRASMKDPQPATGEGLRRRGRPCGRGRRRARGIKIRGKGKFGLYRGQAGSGMSGPLP